MCNKSYFKSQFMSFSIRRKRWVCEHTMPCRLLSSQNNGYIKKNLKRCLVKNSVTIFFAITANGYFSKKWKVSLYFWYLYMQPFYSPFEIVGRNIDKSTCNFLNKNNVSFCIKQHFAWNAHFYHFYTFSHFIGKHLFDFRLHFSHLQSVSVANFGQFIRILALQMLKAVKCKEKCNSNTILLQKCTSLFKYV